MLGLQRVGFGYSPYRSLVHLSCTGHLESLVLLWEQARRPREARLHVKKNEEAALAAIGQRRG
jgi:hypothetical protein